MTVTPAPIADDVVLLVERRRPDSEPVVQRVVRGEAGTFAVEGATEHSDLTSLLRATPELVTLRRGEIATFTVEESVLAGRELAALLRPCPTGGPEDPAAWSAADAEPWTQLATWLDASVDGATPFARWASVNGWDIAVLAPAGARWSNDLVVLCVSPLDGHLRGSETLASFSWWTEGDTTSWDGGAVIEILNRRYALCYETGDEAGRATVVPWPSSARGQAELLSTWLRRHSGEVAAALTWEPLDPERTLDADDRQRWVEVLAEVSFSLEVRRPVLRRALIARYKDDEQSPYARTRQALLAPDDPEGERLYSSLDAVACGGPLWNLLND